jgi:hypothetical protein
VNEEALAHWGAVAPKTKQKTNKQIKKETNKPFLVCSIYLIKLTFSSGKQTLCETPCWPLDIQHAKLQVKYFQVWKECNVVGARLVHAKDAPFSVPLMPKRVWTYFPMFNALTCLNIEAA